MVYNEQEICREIGGTYMEHPFKDKLVTFIGTPLRCKRQEARDALIAVGGLPDDSITAFTNYAVAFNRADGTKLYQRAVKYERIVTLLNEEHFFDILEGKAQPPEPAKASGNISVIPARDAEAFDREQEQFMQ
jgi:NAD-dependent DNA ligase